MESDFCPECDEAVQFKAHVEGNVTCPSCGARLLVSAEQVLGNAGSSPVVYVLEPSNDEPSGAAAL